MISWPAFRLATLGLGGAGGGAGAATGAATGSVLGSAGAFGAAWGVAAGACSELGGAAALPWAGAGGWPCGGVCAVEAAGADCSGAGCPQAVIAIAIAATIAIRVRG